MFGFGKKVTKVFKVEGMACPRCSAAVKTALEKLKGTKAEIDLEKGAVTVTAAAIDVEAIKTAIESCGFEFAGEIQ